MIIKEAVYKKVKVTKNKLVTEAVYGCDCCRKEIVQYPNEDNRLEFTLFRKNEEASYFHFCSWDCVLKYISEIDVEFDFISLPCVYCSNVKESRRGIQRLVEIIKNLENPKR